MEGLERKNGFLDLNKLDLEYIDVDRVYTFVYNNKKYFYKNHGKNNAYKELIAEELAKDYGLNCVHYDLAVYDTKHGEVSGAVSEDFIKDKNYINFIEILYGEYGKEYKNSDTVNLYDIWNALSKKYKDEKLVSKLMNQVVDIFIFDFLIGNLDRHDGNVGILEDERNINIGPVFDNELMLVDHIDFNNVLKVDSDKVYNWKDSFAKFISTSSSEYVDKILEKLWIIDDNNVRSAIERVENRIDSKIDDNLKNKLVSDFRMHRTAIDEILESLGYTENKKSKKVR